MATSSEDLTICTACGTQFDSITVTSCRICDDPRQFIPTSGQSFTTLSSLRSSGTYHNKWQAFANDDRFYSLWTEPKFGIGQRAILIRTEKGNVLWDCVAYLDQETVDWVNSIGGLGAIVISHPHYYTTHLEWARAFGCPIYISWEDKSWLNRFDTSGFARTFVEGEELEITVKGEKTGVKAIKLGGHFDGSLVCLWEGKLLIADTLVTVPSGLYHVDRPAGTISFTFMWSIPNMIPLGPDAIWGMWRVLKRYEFKSTHGAFLGLDIEAEDVKRRVLESMQIQVRREEYTDHPLLKETCE
jgi:glyoxylase-like metal-dependent hydrolase (beta-lactamase superfamily II)